MPYNPKLRVSQGVSQDTRRERKKQALQLMFDEYGPVIKAEDFDEVWLKFISSRVITGTPEEVAKEFIKFFKENGGKK
jgi:hypothetical protein